MKVPAIASLVLLALLPGASAAAQDAPVPVPSDRARPAASERFRNFVLDAAGPAVLVETIGWAGVAQKRESPAGWGSGAKGFGERYASLMGQGVIQEAVTYGLSEALTVDSRFHKSAKHGLLPRAGDAVRQAVASRRADGRRVVSAPLAAGYVAGGLGMITWFPHGYTWKDGVGYGGLALASRAGVNLIREFILRR